MKLNRHLKSNNGFTLVELIVTLAIAAIVMTVAGNYLFFGNRMFAENEVKNTDKYIGDTIFDFMREQIIYATGVEVINPAETDAAPKYEKIFDVDKISDKENGFLCFGPKEVKPLPDIYGESFYRNNGVSYTVKVKNDSLELYLNVQVYNRDGEMVYETGANIKNLNIALNGGNSIIITGAEENKKEHEYVNPIISLSEKQVEKDDELTILANGLYEKMKACLDDYYKLKNKTMTQKEYTDKYGITWPGVSNDIFSKYIYNNLDSNNRWPAFTAKALEELKKLGYNEMYMRVYLNQNNHDITVFGNTKNQIIAAWPETYLIYKNWDEKGNIIPKGTWYIVENKSDKINMVNITHEEIDKKIDDGKVVIFGKEE
ncbi:type II secretion system protein [Eubacterium maltosivorans]|uniref:Prepilin-type N-terminal cleavage/methylation domain-containing protein n=1 Tax=Eubacterium maltosivorans TaxID=2041044 RepID=A0A4P9CAT5_EUBML|nr:prepilin-type N-terminal cleavage/methylation domain-containing protein [Eubacterium maltosivorans]QCT71822.1 prepilin-type N-terminal cleavage/methylation domain-containing protein [Eubacterium maltosivorans]